MSAWRSGGLGPEKTSAGLRGIGLIAIVLAFLAVSNGYVSGGDDEKATDPRVAGRPTVLAPEALRTILPRINANATYRFGTPAAIKTMIEDNDQADVFITTAGADAQSLAIDSRCTDAIQIAIYENEKVVACLPTNVDADSTAGLAYLKTLTNVKGRAALIDAGLDVPTP